MLTGRPQRVRLTEPEAGALLSFLEELELDCADNSKLEELETLVAHAAGAPEDVRSWSAGGPIPAEHVFTPLLEATRDSLRCRISYTGSGGDLYETLIDPYHLRMERGMWYAIARLAEGANAGAERCYRLDKIASVAAEEPFDPDPIDLTAYADGVFRPSGEPRSVTVVFSEQIAAYAEERWGPGRPVRRRCRARHRVLRRGLARADTRGVWGSS
jgi:predicted DNA-binding transcriptional regulator YafY